MGVVMVSSIEEFDVSRLESIAEDLAIKIVKTENEEIIEELIKDLESLNNAINLLR